MPAITRIANPYLSVDISSLGAELQSLTTADGKAWLWNGDATYWSGRSPILFPTVGKAPDNRISIEGKTYDMAQHGFARRSEFALIAWDDTMCRYELTASAATHAVYPFEFLLTLTYTLHGRKLTVATEVENLDTRPMPFGLGYHPAFVWPLPGAEGRAHTVTLDNGAEPALVRLEDGLVTADRLPSPFRAGKLTLDSALFVADAMVFPEGAGAGLTYAAEGGPALKFAFDNLPNLALWQKPGAPFICIEPWHGTAAEHGGSNDLARRPYSLTLRPAEKAHFAFTVELPI